MEMNFNQHISGQFNADLEAIRNHMMGMGGLVERQVANAIDARLCIALFEKSKLFSFIERVLNIL